MSKFQRVKSFLAGVALLLLILILLAVPESGLSIVALILSLTKASSCWISHCLHSV